MLAALTHELGFALRSLARSPWFTSTCILMLAAGLGLSMYMFGAINGFVLKPMPFLDSDRLMYVGYEDREDPTDEQEIRLHDFVEIRAVQTQFEDIAGFYEGTINLSDGERPERYDGVFATAALMTELGMKPHLGRLLSDADNVPGAAPAALISHTLWVNRFNADPGVVGRAVRINGKDATLVGVMPPGFRFPRKHDIWLAMPLDVSTPRADAMSLNAFGRIRPGASPAAAEAEIEAQLARINAAFPEVMVAEHAMVKPYADELISDQTRSILFTMFAAVMLVLLIACGNVANLMVARGAARQRELAIRGALGAGRRRLVMQVLAESIAISLVAGVLGLALAIVGGELTMQAIQSSDDPPVYWVDFSLDGLGVAFAFGVALVSAVAAALLPAWDAARTSAAQAMRAGGAGSIGRGARLGKVLVILEIAVCMALLVGAGLTVRSVIKMQTHDLGIETSNVLSGRIGLFASVYPDAAARVAFAENLQQRLEAIPGVRSATLTSDLPGMESGRSYFHVEGREPPARNQYDASWVTRMTPSYFETFGLRAQAGRLLGSEDRADGLRTAVVNASFAADAWPGESAVGKRFQLNPTLTDSPWLTVVGVVPDTMQGDFEDDAPAAVYLPMAQDPTAFMSFAIKTEGDPYALADAARAAVVSVDPDLPIYWLRTIDDWLDIAMWDGRLLANLFGVFALFALILAMSGIYAVLAYAVGQRVREIGVRRALGARDEGILRMVLGQGGWQLAIGLGIGLVLAVGFGKLLSNFLFDLPSFDPVTFGVVAVLLAAVSVLAGFVPARRALRVEPMAALRYE
jgi:putative ABC transport system permease protein